MQPRLRDYFTFTKRERNGTIALVIVLLLIVIFRTVESNFISTPKENFAQFDSLIASMQKKTADSTASVAGESQKGIPPVAEEAQPHSVFHQKELFYFNPNNLPEDDWVRLGLSPAQARVVKHYEAKGGKFDSKEDVKKMFVISADLYAQIGPYILLPDQPAKPEQKTTADATGRQPKIVELNTADSADLVSIDGIGPAFAKRILLYREKLGGFVSIDQLTEVYGIDATHFTQIKPEVKADSSYVHKININTATVADLKQHPYFGPGVALALVNYRKAHGPFKQLPDIMKCDLVTADLYRKIAPYLTI